MRAVILTLCSILFFHSSSFAEGNDPHNKLLDSAHQYLNFIDQISCGKATNSLDDSKVLFTDDCKKVFNGNLLTSTREAFVLDLLSVYENHGGWKITPVDIIVAPSSHCVILRVMTDLENYGAFTAIVILRYDTNYLVTEINEVFNKKIDGYDFS